MATSWSKESARAAIKAFRSIKSMRAPPGAERTVVEFLEFAANIAPSLADYEANKNPVESSKQKRRKKLLKKEKKT
jgi:P2-related tail formation protein